MIIAIPHIPARADFKKLAKAIESQGNNENHILLVTALPSDGETGEAAEFFDRVKPFFKKAFLVFTPLIDPNVGFNLANTHFSVASRWASQYIPEAGEISNPPVLYLDPAFFPNEANWADSTQAAYFKSGGRCFGETENIDNITLNNGTIVEGGSRFTGPVVFDQKFAASSALINYLRPDELWRTTLRWEMNANHPTSDFFSSKDTYKENVLGDTKKSETPKKPSLDDDDTGDQQKLVTSKGPEVASTNGVRRIKLD